MKTKDMTTLHLGKSIGWSPLRLAFLLIPLVLTCFALSPTAQAQCPSACDSNGNTALGDSAIGSGNNTGFNNTAIGFNALFSNTTGSFNTATGINALINNTTGNFNTANGSNALPSNTTGDSNTADGYQALLNNTTGVRNTAVGFAALANTTTGDRNTATGRAALPNNTTGARNTGDGQDALFNNLTGNDNAATGHFALFNNTTGNNNTANGNFALQGNTTGSSNIALGFNAGGNLTTGSNNIDIGNNGVAAEATTIRIGTQGTQTATYLAGITGKTSPKGMPVFINASGQLGTVTSSERFKDAIKPMDKASEVILALKPVTFHYKKELDPESIPQFGLVAEQVEKVNPDLVVRDGDGKPYTVRYEAVNAMLLNEFLKEHRNVAEQQSTIAELKTTVAQQQKQIEALRTGLQKVTAQVESGNSSARIAISNQ